MTIRTRNANTPKARQAAFVCLSKARPFHIGDTVRIAMKWQEDHFGEEAGNYESFESSCFKVGDQGRITDKWEDGTYELNSNGCIIPFFALEFVKGPTRIELNDEYEAEISEDGKTVEVGCQTITAAKVLELAEAIKAQQKISPKVPRTTRARRRR